MKEAKLQLASNFSIPATDYAGQGNAILGIRDSGKTYTGTKAAEGLLDAGIPIIVYDPIGIWKNLKIGIGKNKGYPIVVAGGQGSDIILTPTNAVEIVRAAMKENVSLVIDLYSPELINKSTWIRIVQETVDELMYQNKNYGMRHIFIEEAAEFIPQRLQPQHSRVYASLERLARMGRNAHLGMTIINQRAEEVNKAILEIMALCLLHKQVGKNSLLSIKKWLELRSLDKSADSIINQLPQLKQGECFVISDEKPLKIQVLPKNTLHPDPKHPMEAVTAKVANVSSFVEKMNEQLKKDPPPGPKSTNSKVSLHTTGNVNQLSKIQEKTQQLETSNNQLVIQIKQKDQEIALLKKAIAIYERRNTDHASAIIKIAERLTDSHGIKIQEIVTDVHKNGINPRQVVTKIPKSDHRTSRQEEAGSVSGGAMRMLKAAAMFHPESITKNRMAALARLSHTSGSFSTYLSTLKRYGLIDTDGNNFIISNSGLKMAGDVDPLPTDPMELIELWCDVVGSQGGAARMLRELGARYPNWVPKENLGEYVQMSHTSGSFSTYLSTLKRNGLIQVQNGSVRAAEELFN